MGFLIEQNDVFSLAPLKCLKKVYVCTWWVVGVHFDKLLTTLRSFEAVLPSAAMEQANRKFLRPISA
jgi:hypothetical protein